MWCFMKEKTARQDPRPDTSLDSCVFVCIVFVLLPSRDANDGRSTGPGPFWRVMNIRTTQIQTHDPPATPINALRNAIDDLNMEVSQLDSAFKAAVKDVKGI